MKVHEETPYFHGFSTRTPVGIKCFSLRVTTVSPCSATVACGDIRVSPAKLSTEPSPALGNGGSDRENTFIVGKQQLCQPIGEALGKVSIFAALLADSAQFPR